MTTPEASLHDISDTARWAAVYRSRETLRGDSLFRDHFAGRLAGARGEQIAATMPAGTRNAWGWVTRTYLFDRIILDQVADGVDLVINLAAGLDARPYRMDLPSSLRWIEVDLPELLASKTHVLRDESPVCKLERIPLDLSDGILRRELLGRFSKDATKVLVLSEGLLVFLNPLDVTQLARDIAGSGPDPRWAFDLVSPGLLRRFRKQWGRQLDLAGAAYQFGLTEGPEFFEPYGWRTIGVHSILKTAARLGRLTPWMRLIAALPESTAAQGWWPWSGVCLMQGGSKPALAGRSTELTPLKHAA